MSNYRVAARYAKSLLDLANETGKADAVHQDMVYLTDICEQNYEFARMLRNPIISHDKKLNVLLEVFKDGQEITKAIFKIMCRKNREAVLPGLAHEYHRLYNIMTGAEDVVVKVAEEVTPAVVKDFEILAKKYSNKKINLSVEVDPELIGGFVLRVDDRQIDESVKTMLQKLKNEFSENPYVEKF